MSLKFDAAMLRADLMAAAEEAAGELTATFFRAVDQQAPVEAGHLHQTFGEALDQLGMPGVMEVRTSLLSKGSGDEEATKRAYGSVVRGSDSLRVTVGTHVGFVNALNDGGTATPEVFGSTGFKEGGVRTEGQLYASRKNNGPMGFLMWEQGGVKHFTRSHTWGPLGFFEAAEQAVESQAQEMGLK